MESISELVFSPLVPVWLLALIGAALALALLLTLRRIPRHAPLRIAAALVFLLLLANPVREEERRETVDDIGLVLIDRSDSMGVEDRTARAEQAAEALGANDDGVEWQVRDIAAEDDGGTRLGSAVESAIGAADTARLGGVFVISDGISEDELTPGLLPRGVPLHHLVAGNEEVNDRRLVVEHAPPFTIAGEDASIRVRIEDTEAAPVPLTIRTGSGYRAEQRLVPGEAATIEIPVERRGDIDVALSVPVRPGEATAVNNRALVSLQGVTERLSVLLVSGRPYPGGRVWRDIFKADPNIDLVHFTILRLPSSFDTTPPQDLALIPFPVEELFQERLADFDLIIFDRFDLTELMSPAYFYSLAERAEAGGGLLVVAGPEFAGPAGLANTALSRVLPAVPAGGQVTESYVPRLTPDGRRHPVTRTLAPSGEAGWGNWGSLAEMQARSGDVLMRGPGDRPLFILDRVGRGRVGLLASTGLWWWARAVEGQGPHAELLRRTAHWLMQEPDLEEEQLRVNGTAESLIVESDSMQPLSAATVTAPDGSMAEIALPASGRAEIPMAEPGLYEVSAGQRRRFALVGNTAEFDRLRPDTEALSEAVTASGGGTFRLSEGVSDIRRVSEGSGAAGADWAGVRRREAGALLAVETRSLVPAWAPLLLIAALLGFAWWRERK